MSPLQILAKCPLAKCPLAKCPLDKCPLAKYPLAKCPGFVIDIYTEWAFIASSCKLMLSSSYYAFS